MKINLRVDYENLERIRATVFVDGRNCGQLCMGALDFYKFESLLSAGMNEIGDAEDDIQITEP